MNKKTLMALWLALFLSIIAAGCLSGGAPKECSASSGLNYSCVVSSAIRDNAPQYCDSLGGSLDDPCMQDYYEKINDSSACNRISKEGVKLNCEKYYS